MYYKDHPKSTKLYITYEFKSERSGHSISILDLGGKKRQEADEISRLLEIILSDKSEYRDIKLSYSDDKFEIGDRVVVIKAQDFDGNEIGQKGNIIKEITNKHNALFYLIKFDNKFEECMIDDDFDFGDEELKDGNCWAFKPDYIKKISKKNEVALNIEDFIGLGIS